MNNSSFTFIFILLFSLTGIAQDEKLPPVMSLGNVIEQAQLNSPSYQKAITTATNSYWGYRSYRSSLFPSLNLDATVPNFQAGNDRIQQPDGSYTLRSRSVIYNSAYLSIDQNVPFTGGVLTVASSLNRNETFAPTPELQYFSVPFIFNYNQPMLLYNDFSWNKKIQPLLYDESLKKYTEDIEKISIETSQYFFDAVSSENSFQLAKLNSENLDTLYQLSQGRYNLGKIAENDLLSIELRLLNADNALYQSGITRENTYKNLMRYLGYPLDTVIQFALPNNIPDLIILEEKAVL